MCEKPETETETVTPRVAFATILQSLVAESPNKPTLWRKPAAASRAGRMT